MNGEEEASEHPIYRNILLTVIRGGILALVGGIILISMAPYATHLPPGVSARSASAAGIMAGVGLALLALAIRVVDSRISAGPDGLFVHREFRGCQYVPWLDVLGLELSPVRRFNNQFTGAAVAVARMAGEIAIPRRRMTSDVTRRRDNFPERRPR